MCNRDDLLKNILRLFKIYTHHKESEINYQQGVKFWPKFIFIDDEALVSYIMLQCLSEENYTTVIFKNDKFYYFTYKLCDDVLVDSGETIPDISDLNLITSSLKSRIIETCI